MSVSLQTQVWHAGLAGNEMLLMQAIADVGDDDGTAYPSVAYLCWKTGLSRSGVQNILGAFRDHGYLSGILDPDAGDASTKYRIVVENLPTKAPWKGRKGREPGTSGRRMTLPKPWAGYPAQNNVVPCPISEGTLPKTAKRNKEDTSVDTSVDTSGGGAPEIPTDLHPLNYAVKLMEEIGMPDVFANREAVAAAIKVEAKGRSLSASYEFLLALALDALDQGEAVDKFWFTDTCRRKVKQAWKSPAARKMDAFFERHRKDDQQ